MSVPGAERETHLRVVCYSGCRGEETPRRIHFGSRQVGVRRIMARWMDPDHRYFRVRGSDGGIYVIRHSRETNAWSLEFVNSGKSHQ